MMMQSNWREENMGNKKSEFYNRIRLGLEDKLLKNHDVTIEYPMDEEDEIVFGVIGNYERDYMVRDELEDNIQFTKGDSIELLKIVDELILTNSKLDEYKNGEYPVCKDDKWQYHMDNLKEIV